MGVKVTQLEESSFELYYYESAIKEVYVNGYLRLIEDSNNNTISLEYEVVKKSHEENNSKKDEKLLLKKIENSSKASWEFVYNEEGFIKSMMNHAKRTWTFHYTKEHYLSYITLNKTLEESYLKRK
ncbi:MAG: Unknown protein [uncultured Sulfurovum sp.]|uniref:Uncharacterized protein n=1 Tax=uncultured Sulfurovum sp. TaxID=269237 RepID=A0A6S6T606_9BACT|nr:MAG: Unknown protein [uncultured Sulfurovum sp.]